MRVSLPLLCLSLLAGSLPTARAEVLVGGFAPWDRPRHPLSAFASDAQGGEAPLRRLEGPATQLVSPAFGVYEPGEGVIYVSDFYGEAVRVYRAHAGGDSAPLRVLNPVSLGQTRASAPIPAHNELMVIATNCCIYTYALDASGVDAKTLRRIVWGGLPGSPTQLGNPSALTYVPATDEVAVIELASDGASQVVFHARTAENYVAPTRVLKSAHTAAARGLAHDPVAGTLMLLVEETTVDGRRGAIRIFDADAANTDVPLRTIAGAATQLAISGSDYLTGLGFDADLDRMMVGIGGNPDPANNRVVVFAAGATGDATPVQVLAGPTLGPGIIGTPFAVPDDSLLRDGFDG